MSAQLAHCILERKRAYTSPYSLQVFYCLLMVYWRPSTLTLLLWNYSSQSIWISIFNEKKKNLNLFFFHKTLEHWFLSLVSFHRSKKKKKETQCRVWVNTLMHGSPVLETYWSWTIRYQAWALFRGAIVSQCWKGVQHKTTPMAASLIAHRTSDTEKNNNFKNCRKC